MNKIFGFLITLIFGIVLGLSFLYPISGMSDETCFYELKGITSNGSSTEMNILLPKGVHWLVYNKNNQSLVKFYQQGNTIWGYEPPYIKECGQSISNIQSVISFKEKK